MSKPKFGDYGEPWIDDDGLVYFRQQDGLPSSDVFDYSEWGGTDDEGRRIASRMVACVNACSGLSDKELKRVRAVNEMYEALKYVRKVIDGIEGCWWIACPDKGGFDTDVILSALALADGREPERGSHE